MLDKKMRKGKFYLFLLHSYSNMVKYIEVDTYHTIDATPAFVREDSLFLKKSKKTLLMFRRIEKNAENSTNKLELRHQRTGDIVFDWIGKYNKLFMITCFRSYKSLHQALVLCVQTH